MAKDPAVLFYTSDFLTGVMNLDMEERGQYITLLCAQHQKGALDEKTIRLLVGSVSVSVLEKFERLEDGTIRNARMNEEALKRSAFVESRRENGSLGGRPPKNKKPSGKPYAKPRDNLPENENENENENRKMKFTEFWEVYPRRNGKRVGKVAARELFDKIPVEELDRVIRNARNYGINNDYPKDPERFLKKEFWKDWDEPQTKSTENGRPKPSKPTFSQYPKVN